MYLREDAVVDDDRSNVACDQWLGVTDVLEVTQREEDEKSLTA